MATGRGMYLTGRIGEYLVAAELCRRGFIATTFAGNAPDFDIFAAPNVDASEKNKDIEAMPVQVKAITKGDWQFHADEFLEIFTHDGVQTVKGEKTIKNPNLICVFVRLKGEKRDQDEFYICRRWMLQDIIFNKYRRGIEKKHGKRRDNPKSTHCAVSLKDIEKYKDRWDIIEDNKDRLGAVQE